ncbi:MAG: malto-oligosyltrehalose trehalohydrolase [Candidatus Omnitrophota bacterium]
MKIGSYCLGEGKCEFVVWAPFLDEVALKIVSPAQSLIPMEKDSQGYWRVLVSGASARTRYLYRLNNQRDRPDPASFYQPAGVHRSSQVVDHGSFKWEDSGWDAGPLEKMLIYELHTGTFTAEGTFAAAIDSLGYLEELGVNTLEIMPVAQFPGERNWGYDGAYLFAVQNSYGGPQGLKELVNACHKKGFSVILDVVYNHFGPEGNYIAEFGPYFTEKYKTPWGKAINFDDAYSDHVRAFFIQNALYWMEHYHIDALRLDAIHGICDMSAKHILRELAEEVGEFSRSRGRKFYLIAESDLNDARVVRDEQSGGYGIDAQWCDDFHHSVHALLTGEDTGYYADFGKIGHLVKSLREGFVYSWDYSGYRKKRHGSCSRDIPANRLVAFIQNHDQAGNRMFGERLAGLVPFEALKLAAGVLLFSPYVPLLFMGEEFAEESPFLYFVDHSDPGLIKAVREGRKREFDSFRWRQEPPDPQSIETFLRSKLKWENRDKSKHRAMLDFYKELIRLRKESAPLANLNKNNLKVWGTEEKRLLFMERWHSVSRVYCIMNFSDREASFFPDFIEGKAGKLIDSSDVRWLGPGSGMPGTLQRPRELVAKPFCLVMYKKES